MIRGQRGVNANKMIGFQAAASHEVAPSSQDRLLKLGKRERVESRIPFCCVPLRYLSSSALVHPTLPFSLPHTPPSITLSVAHIGLHPPKIVGQQPDLSPGVASLNQFSFGTLFMLRHFSGKGREQE